MTLKQIKGKIRCKLKRKKYKIIENDDSLILILRNIFMIREDVTQIALTNSDGIAIIDTKALFDVLSYSWHQVKKGYVRNSKNELMHRFLMQYPEGKEVDHIDHNPLNNRLKNLRVVTSKQNSENQLILSKTTNTGFTGIRQVDSGSFRVDFFLDGEQIKKYFPTVKQAFIHRIFLIRVHYTHHLLCNHSVNEIYSDDELFSLAERGQIDDVLIKFAHTTNGIHTKSYFSPEQLSHVKNEISSRPTLVRIKQEDDNF